MSDSPAKIRVSSREIWSLAWPQVLMMVFHFLIGFVDVWVAGRIGRDVQASLGMINQLLFFFLVVAIAVANGSVAAISQSMGAGLEDRARRYIGLVLLVGLTMGGVIVGLGLAVDGLLLDLLQVPAELREVTSYFLDVFLLLLPIYYLFVIANAVFRARKQVMAPLYAMMLTTVVNTAGDLGLGLGWWGLPDLGYKGVAWATFGSITAGMLFDLFLLARQGLLSRASLAPLRWSRRAFPYLFKVAWPGGLMQVVWHSAYLVLFAITASLPEGSVTALAGMTAGLRVESALFLPGFAFNLTASVLVGQYLGKGEPEHAKAVAYRVLGLGVAGIMLLAGVVWLFVDPITAFIAPDPAVAAESVDYLLWNVLAIPFTLTGMILAGAMAGAGATLYNLMIFGVSAWCVRVPLAWHLGHQVFAEADGIWISMFVSQIFQAGLTLWCFHFRDWSRFAMIKRRKHAKGTL